MLYLSNGLYGKRNWKHRDLYEQETGWWFLELGSYTLEIDFNKADEVSVKPPKKVHKEIVGIPWYSPRKAPYWMLLIGEYVLHLTVPMNNWACTGFFAVWVVWSLNSVRVIKQLRRS